MMPTATIAAASKLFIVSSLESCI